MVRFSYTTDSKVSRNHCREEFLFSSVPAGSRELNKLNKETITHITVFIEKSAVIIHVDFPLG
jgi:hypothetical protein